MRSKTVALLAALLAVTIGSLFLTMHDVTRTEAHFRTYHYNYSGDGLLRLKYYDTTGWASDVDSATSLWNNTPTTLWFTRTTNPNDAQVRISGYYDCNDGNNAHTNPGFSNGVYVLSAIQVNQCFSYNHVQVIAHELGHALGLDDISCFEVLTASIMKDGLCNPYTTPQAHDVSDINTLYRCRNSADINRDGTVGVLDLSILLSKWDTAGPGDINCSGSVDVFDLSVMLSQWNTAGSAAARLASAEPVPTAAEAVPTAALAVGTLTASDGVLDVPVVSTGATVDAYIGYSIHLRWNPGLLAFQSVDPTGGLLDPGAGVGTCHAAAIDSDSAGMSFACTHSSPIVPITTGGLLATAHLAVLGSGCTPIHIVTRSSPDNAGDIGSSLITLNSEPQDNALTDSSSDQAGNACTPSLVTDDVDHDRVSDSVDNCAATFNPDQIDSDHDGLGDSCDPDDDNDGLLDAKESIAGSNPRVADTDSDGCADGLELGPSARRGGERSPTNAWDFYDVPAPALRLGYAGQTLDHGIGVTTDVVALLAYSGLNSGQSDYTADYDGNGIQDGLQYDRSATTAPDEPWLSGPPDGAIGVTTDVVTILKQSGTRCR